MQRHLHWESVLILYASENFLGLSVLKTRLQRSNWDRWTGFKGHLSQPDLDLLHRPENAHEAPLEALSVNALADTNQPSFQLSFHVKLLDLDMWFLHHLSRSYHIMFHTQTQPKKLLQKLQLDTKQTDIKMLQFFFFFSYSYYYRENTSTKIKHGHVYRNRNVYIKLSLKYRSSHFLFCFFF